MIPNCPFCHAELEPPVNLETDASYKCNKSKDHFVMWVLGGDWWVDLMTDKHRVEIGSINQKEYYLVLNVTANTSQNDIIPISPLTFEEAPHFLQKYIKLNVFS